jgi:hypothetical protein
MSPDEIKGFSVAKIEHPETYEEGGIHPKVVRPFPVPTQQSHQFSPHFSNSRVAYQILEWELSIAT